MREIKFRFWSKILNNFVIPNDDIFVGALKDKNMEVMQYTGLKDKNGKEIYEGDICNIKLMKGYEFIGEMVWYHLGWKIRSIEGKGGQGMWTYKYFENPRDVKVIGNIWEHPELLKNE